MSKKILGHDADDLIALVVKQTLHTNIRQILFIFHLSADKQTTVYWIKEHDFKFAVFLKRFLLTLFAWYILFIL